MSPTQGGIPARTEQQVTAAYRQAKKGQATAAYRVAALRSEVAGLESRKKDLIRAGRCTTNLDSMLERTQRRLASAEQTMEQAHAAYRVAHVELLILPGPQSHYEASIQKQRLYARISEDEHETAVLRAMESTLTMLAQLASYRAALKRWEVACRNHDTRQSAEGLIEASAQCETGIYRSPSGNLLEVHLQEDGTLRAANGTLGYPPFDYIPGGPYMNGNLALRADIITRQWVDPSPCAGYVTARRVMA